MPFRRAPNCATAPSVPSNGRRTVYRLPLALSTAVPVPRLTHAGRSRLGSPPGVCAGAQPAGLLGGSFCGCSFGAAFGSGPAGVTLRLGGGAVLFLAAEVDLEAGCLAAEVAEVVQLGATGAAAAHDLDVADEGRVQRENALDTFTGADLADGDRAGGTLAVLTGDDDTLESLDAAAVALDHAVVDADRVPRVKVRVIIADVRLVNRAHDGAFVVLHRLFS